MSRFSRSRLERSLEALWYGRSPAALLLQPFALLFSLIVALRIRAYRWGLFKSERVSVPVIVVGNITVGGTGKTPVVAWLAGKLTAMGFRPGIVSRGYGGKSGPDPLIVTEHSRVEEVGDEALVLARRTRAPICIAVDRVSAARHLAATADIDVIIADDGLQHYRLARDCEIVVVDGRRMLGNERMLPAGPLREPARRLREVNMVLTNGDASADLGFELHPDKAVSLTDWRHRDLDRFGGQRAWSVAGIGNPARFSTMLTSFGVEPVEVEVADHGTVSLPALRRKESWPILMTEKDAVKYLDATVDDAWYVPVKLQMSAQSESSILDKIQALISDG